MSSTDSMPLLPLFQYRSLFSHTQITHHVHQCDITHHITSKHTLTSQVKVFKLCQVCQALTQCLSSLYSNGVHCPHTYHTSHHKCGITHNTQSSISMHILTTQVKVCELNQVCQVLTQCLCSLYSNVVHCTHTHKSHNTS